MTTARTTVPDDFYYPQRPPRRYGGGITDTAEISRIQARIHYASLPLWRRLFTRAPQGWR